MDKQDIMINIDDTGIGGGCTDMLRHKGYQVQAINFGEAAQDKNKYANTITEMWFQFSEQINSVDIPENNELLEELTDRTYTYDNKERKKVEAKDQYKKRNGKSPDLADALLLCFYNRKRVDFESLENVDFVVKKKNIPG